MSKQRITTTALNVIESLFTSNMKAVFKQGLQLQACSYNSFLNTIKEEDKRGMISALFSQYPYIIRNIKRVDSLNGIYTVELVQLIENIECMAIVELRFKGYFHDYNNGKYLNYFMVNNATVEIKRKRVS